MMANGFRVSGLGLDIRITVCLSDAVIGQVQTILNR